MLYLLPLLSVLLPTAPPAETPVAVLVIVGAAGEESYGKQFDIWAKRWETAARQGGAEATRIDRQTAAGECREQVQRFLADLQQAPPRQLWMVLIGHGVFDGRRAKFNLEGPDFSAEELAEWLAPIKRPTAIINCASSSGPFIHRLAAPHRVLVTATNSGAEYNFARFGEYASLALASQQIDLDKDGQTSLLEIFLAASAGVADYYAQESRLATEHALLEDNGDGLGVSADWFRGYRAVRAAKLGAIADGDRAAQFVLIPSAAEAAMPEEVRIRREAIESQIAELRRRKASLPTESYFEQLEPLLLELARLYRDQEN